METLQVGYLHRGRRRGALLALAALPGQRHRLARQPQRPHATRSTTRSPSRCSSRRRTRSRRARRAASSPSRSTTTTWRSSPAPGLGAQDPRRDDRPPVARPVAARGARPAGPRRRCCYWTNLAGHPVTRTAAAPPCGDTDRADLRRPCAVRDHDAGQDGRETMTAPPDRRAPAVRGALARFAELPASSPARTCPADSLGGGPRDAAARLSPAPSTRPC